MSAKAFRVAIPEVIREISEFFGALQPLISHTKKKTSAREILQLAEESPCAVSAGGTPL